MAISANKRHDVFMKTFYHCAYCGKILSDTDDLTIDHKNPVAKGGTDEIDNLFGCCRSCNQIKADSTVSEFRKKLKDAAKISNAFSGERYNQNIVFFFEKYCTDDLMKINDLYSADKVAEKAAEMEEKYNNLVKYVSYIAEKLDTKLDSSISHQDNITEDVR
jgi:hypothetical protein